MIGSDAAASILQARLIDIGVRFANFRAIVESIPAGLNIVILVAGAILVTDGSMTPGELVSVAYLITLMAFPLQLIGFVIFEMAHSQAAWTTGPGDPRLRRTRRPRRPRRPARRRRRRTRVARGAIRLRRR